MSLHRALLLACLIGLEALRRQSKRNSLLTPIDTNQPDPILFPPRSRSPLEPVNYDVQGPKQTNKFWGSWTVNDGNSDFSIFPSPYTLRWRPEGGSPSGSLYVMKGETDYQGPFYTTHWLPDFIMGAVETFEGSHTIVQEQHFGILTEVRPAGGFSCTATYPVFAGMAYPSAKYEGGCTPRVTSDYGLTVAKVSAGIWSFKSVRKEYRVYALTQEGQFVDDSFDFDSTGTLNKQLDGWIRLADLQSSSDVTVLDRHARKILVGWELQMEEGIVQYNFETVGPSDVPLLNWAYANHMAFLDGGASLEEGLTRTRSPAKGLMFPLVGDTWIFKVDLTEALAVGFVPNEEPRAEWIPTLQAEAERDALWFVDYWRNAMHKRDHYFSGKGFQKLGQVCHILKKFYGGSDSRVTQCAALLQEGFRCMWDRNVSDSSDRRLAGPDGSWQQEVGCWWSPFGTWYDLSWGGIPSRWDDSPICGLDFGNSCYNDHHYHWGYFVVAGAMLVDLIPSMAQESRFVELINMFIRDVANPSTADPYFPQFRAFDWFDMHSWSRGLKPDPSGKDQESTSEEVNFHYGQILWGKVMGNDQVAKLGATSLTMASRALQEYFLNKRDNPNHPPSFSQYHVTGIFFQNKVHLTTWFGGKTEYIHGIQMLPLTSGLGMSRKDDFCFEEWMDRLDDLTIDLTDPWWSILLSGNLAIWDPERAWSLMVQMAPENFDDGLTKAWALYWTAVQKADGPRPTPAPVPPVPTIAPGVPTPASTDVWCNPMEGQICPDGNLCPQCGASACLCGSESVPTPPTPPTPPTSGIFCNPNLGQFCPGGIECPQCGSNACECP